MIEDAVVIGEPVVSGHTDGITMDLCLVPGDYIPVEETLRALERLIPDGKGYKVETWVNAEQVRAFRAGERHDLGRIAIARASFATRPTIAEAWRERRPLEPGEPENAG